MGPVDGPTRRGSSCRELVRSCSSRTLRLNHFHWGLRAFCTPPARSSRISSPSLRQAPMFTQLGSRSSSFGESTPNFVRTSRARVWSRLIEGSAFIGLRRNEPHLLHSSAHRRRPSQFVKDLLRTVAIRHQKLDHFHECVVGHLQQVTADICDLICRARLPLNTCLEQVPKTIE